MAIKIESKIVNYNVATKEQVEENGDLLLEVEDEFDLEDEIISGSIITHGGEVTNETIKNILEGGN